MTALHGLLLVGGVAVGAGVLEDLLLDGDGSFEEVGVSVGESDPLGLALVEAEVAARPGAPLVVVGQTDAGVVEDPHDAVVVDVRPR